MMHWLRAFQWRIVYKNRFGLAILPISHYYLLDFRKPDDDFVSNAQESYIAHHPNANPSTINYMRPVWKHVSKLQDLKVKAALYLKYNASYARELKKLEKAFDQAQGLYNKTIGSTIRKRMRKQYSYIASSDNSIYGFYPLIWTYQRRSSWITWKYTRDMYLDRGNAFKGQIRNPRLSSTTLQRATKLLESTFYKQMKLQKHVNNNKFKTIKLSFVFIIKYRQLNPRQKYSWDQFLEWHVPTPGKTK